MNKLSDVTENKILHAQNKTSSRWRRAKEKNEQGQKQKQF